MTERPKVTPKTETPSFTTRTDRFPHWLKRTTELHPADLVQTGDTPRTVFRVTTELTSKRMRTPEWRKDQE